jgi:dihydroorotate dehydrogenase
MSTFTRGVSSKLASHIFLRSHTSSRPLFTKAKTVRRSPAQSGLYATAFLLSTGLFAVYYFDVRSALHRYFLTPLLRHTLDAETGHKVAVKVLKSGLGPRDPMPDDQRLEFKVFTIGHLSVNHTNSFSSYGDRSSRILLDWLLDSIRMERLLMVCHVKTYIPTLHTNQASKASLTLGLAGLKSAALHRNRRYAVQTILILNLTDLQPGNPRPRVFHLSEDSGLINRYGFPSQGHTSMLSRLRARTPAFQSEHESAALRPGSILAVNLGKNKESPADSIDDFVAGVRTFGPYSDVLVVNVSSPNTPGLR